MSGPENEPAAFRSRNWFAGDDEPALLHRAALRQAGIVVDRSDTRPVIGITQTASDLNPCNRAFAALGRDVRDGIEAAGGIPVEFPVMSLGEDLMKPSAMLYRNLVSIEVEETLRAYPIDGVVLLGNCDKTIPAALMGAASADLPAILLTGGTRGSGTFRGEPTGAGTDLWRHADARRAGLLDDAAWADLEQALGCCAGACNVMGTASTIALLSEVLGMLLPGVGSYATDDVRLRDAAKATGARAVELSRSDVRPSHILTLDAFRNAFVILAALGGSTNAVLHLVAIARRLRLPVDLALVAEWGRSVPVLADVRPSGRFLMDAFAASGGVLALAREVADRLALTTMTVAGGTLGDLIADAPPRGDAIRGVGEPVAADGGLVVLRGSLAPDGAILKASAASPGLLAHRGRAVVFDSYSDMLARIDDPDLPVDASSVLVLRNVGPVGVPGMPEWGMIPIPARLLREGVTDVVRISDGRMSGTSFGTCILHVAPEAAVGGPLALVQEGDEIVLDAPGGRLELAVPTAELEGRRSAWLPPRRPHGRGWPRLYAEHVLQAPDGCDLDFLVPDSADAQARIEPIIGRG